MVLELITDMIGTLGKVGSRLNAIVNVPNVERETIGPIPHDMDRLIDTSFNRLIVQWDSVLFHPSDDHFLGEAVRLDNAGRAGVWKVARGRGASMTEHRLFYYPYASFTRVS